MDPRHYRRGTRRGTWLGGRVAGAAGARVARFPILLKSVQVKSKLYQISPRLPLTILWCFRGWKREADRLCFRTKCDPFLWRAVNPASTTAFSLENLRILRYLGTIWRKFYFASLLSSLSIVTIIILLLRMQISFLLLHFSRKLEDRCIKHLLRERFLLKHDGF